jgi:hypothetical protein
VLFLDEDYGRIGEEVALYKLESMIMEWNCHEQCAKARNPMILGFNSSFITL